MTDQNYEAAYKAGLAASEVRGTPFVDYVVLLDVNGAAYLEYVDDEQFRDAPRRRRGRFSTTDLGAFCQYVATFGEVGTRIYEIAQGAYEAVIDGHSTVAAGWGAHCAAVTRETTSGYNAWTSRDREWLDQDSFIEFLESRMGEIAAPDGAELWEIVRNFEAHSDVAFSRVRRLENGRVELQYSENPTGGADLVGAGRIEIPTEFTIALEPYVDTPDEGFLLAVRLRWRLSHAKVEFQIRLDEDELDRRMIEAGVAARARIADHTAITPLIGSWNTSG